MGIELVQDPEVDSSPWPKHLKILSPFESPVWYTMLEAAGTVKNYKGSARFASFATFEEERELNLKYPKSPRA